MIGARYKPFLSASVSPVTFYFDSEAYTKQDREQYVPDKQSYTHP